MCGLLVGGCAYGRMSVLMGGCDGWCLCVQVLYLVTSCCPIRLFWVNGILKSKLLWVLFQYTHTRLTALCPGLPGWAGTRKVKPVWILLEQETVSGSGISWAVCKPAPRSRQITTPAPHHSVFTGRMPFLLPDQQRQSTEGHNIVAFSIVAFCSNTCQLFCETCYLLVCCALSVDCSTCANVYSKWW